MKVTKVVLIKDGYGGVTVSGSLPKVKGNITIKSPLRGLDYKIPLPDELRDLISRMRKYLLDIYGIWKPEYEKYFEKGDLIDTDSPTDMYYEVSDILRNTVITSIEVTANVVNLVGYIVNKYKMILPLKPPGINYNDGYEKYDKLLKGSMHICKKIGEFIDNKELKKMDSKQYMLDLFGDDPDKITQIESLTKTELNDLMTKQLEESGFIVIHNEEREDETDVAKEMTSEEKEDLSNVERQMPDEEGFESAAVNEIADDNEKTEI